MSQIKNAQLRYRVIDRCIRNAFKPFPSKETLRLACEEALYGSSGGSDICDSTIEKDMFAMRMDFDAPIKYSKKDGGYYYEDESYSIEKIPLSEEDVEAIRFAAKTLMQFRDVGIFNQFSYALDKIFERAHIAGSSDDKDLKSFVQFETVQKTSGGEYLGELLKAIKEKKVISFLYAGFSKNKAKERKVLPLLLKEYRNRWYLISYCLERKRIITFGLDRISGLKVTTEQFKGQVQFDSVTFFEHSIGITANDSAPEKVVFKVDDVSAKYLSSQPLHPTQKLVKEGKNRMTFEIDVIISEELKRELLSYGSQLEVLKPRSLRNEIRNIVQEMNEVYG